MKAVILAAGRGQRFLRQGFSVPKLLIEVGGNPVLSYNLLSVLDLGIPTIVVGSPKVCHWVRCEDLPGVTCVEVPVLQASPVHSALLASGLLEPNDQVMVLDGDQIYSPAVIPTLFTPIPFRYSSRVVATRSGKNPSFCSVYEVNEFGDKFACLVEKDGGSNLVVSGGYGFSSWRSFQQAAFKVLAASDPTSQEARMSEVVNQLGNIEVLEIRPEDWTSVGTPEELRAVASEPVRSYTP